MVFISLCVLIVQWDNYLILSIFVVTLNFQNKKPIKEAFEEPRGAIANNKMGIGPTFKLLAMNEEGVGKEG